MMNTSGILQELEATKDGTFSIEKKDGQAFLTVFPPGEYGQTVKVEEVYNRLDILGLLDRIDKQEVEQHCLVSDGDSHAICLWPGESSDVVFDIKISDDSMTAFLIITPPKNGGRWIDASALAKATSDAGITHGLDQNCIKAILGASGASELKTVLGELITEDKGNLRIAIASGKQPRHGINGYVKTYFNPHPSISPREESPNKINFRELNVIQTCKEGALLAEIISPEEGSAGFDVRGNMIAPKQPEEAEIIDGKNTKKIDGRLYATTSGHVRITDGRSCRIEVDEILEVDKVDFSIGNINFPGTVHVRGTVLDGFRIRAEGDIIIDESVSNVILHAQGNIVLGGGISAKSDTFVWAKENIYAKFVQGVSIQAGQSIYIEEAAIHSELSAREAVFIEGGRGELIGGQCYASSAVRTNKIGARAGTETKITVGIDPETLESLMKLDAEYLEKNRMKRKVETHIRQVEESEKRGRTISLEEKAQLEKVILAGQKLDKILAALEKQRELLKNVVKVRPDAYVEARDCVYPGVEVSFGMNTKRRIDRVEIPRYTKFIFEKGVISLLHSDL